MRVLHVYKSYYPDTLGGIEQVIAQLAQALREFGVESRIFTLSRDPHPPAIQRPEGEVFRSRMTAEIASNPVSLSALPEFRTQLRWADVVHYQFPWPFADLMHLLVGRRKPSVVSYQSDIVRQKVLLHAYAPLMRRFLDAADAVVATSPTYRDTSPALARLARPVHVIPNGIDETTYPMADPVRMARWMREVGEGFFLFVGVLRYYKGLHTLLEAARGLRGQVVIAGDGPEAAALREQAQALGLSNVRFLGHVTEEDKIALLLLARAFVFPSHLRSEAFGMSLVEAAMCGRPMVSCDIGSGMSYINLHGQTGYSVPPEQPEALREAMHRLQDDPESAAAMGRAARERFETHFTARRMAQGYAGVYREVLGAGATAAA
jgi:glycosyltransferase involved in cell wall biosynthesis